MWGSIGSRMYVPETPDQCPVVFFNNSGSLVFQIKGVAHSFSYASFFEIDMFGRFPDVAEETVRAARAVLLTGVMGIVCGSVSRCPLLTATFRKPGSSVPVTAWTWEAISPQLATSTPGAYNGVRMPASQMISLKDGKFEMAICAGDNYPPIEFPNGGPNDWPLHASYFLNVNAAGLVLE